MAAAIAAGLVLLHLAFVVFVVGGVLLVWKWPRLAWLHVPAVAWAVWIETTGGICPLTPLENAWRASAGLPLYEGDFIARWVFPLLYPQGLTRHTQVGMGLAALSLNAAGYTRLLWRWHQLRKPRDNAFDVETRR
jgi:hypothetical protein